jgi:hypothetical protein
LDGVVPSFGGIEFNVDPLTSPGHPSVASAFLGWYAQPHLSGAPLWLGPGRVSLERILDRMCDIRLSDEHHGSADVRRFRCEPTWVLRGLKRLHLEFSSAEGAP